MNYLLGERNTATRPGSELGSFDFTSWTPWQSWCSVLTASSVACMVTVLFLSLTYCFPFAYPYLRILDNFGFDAESIFWIFNWNCLQEIIHLKRVYYAVISILFRNLCFSEFISQEAMVVSINQAFLREKKCKRWIHGVDIRTTHSVCSGYLRSPQAIGCDNCCRIWRVLLTLVSVCVLPNYIIAKILSCGDQFPV